MASSAAPQLPPLPKNRFRLWVDDDAANQLRAYKYSGVDLSYIYRYVLTPMNEFLVRFIPEWVAPNVITLFGLVICVICHYVTYLHNPTFDRAMPEWVYLYIGFTLWAYQTIDNLDGKQARKTGNGSALGLLFDHGVDALNTTIMTLAFATVMQVGCTIKLTMFWFCTFCPFVFATWDEYYTHKLTLSELNGPTDGVLLSVGMCIIGWSSPGIWAKPIGVVFESAKGTAVGDYEMHCIVLFLGFLGIGLTALSNVVRVLRSEAGSAAGFVAVMMKLTPFTQLISLAACWAVYSPYDVYHKHTRLFIYAMGVVFGQLICKLMLAHLTHQNYRIFRTSLFPFTAAVINAVGPRFVTPNTPTTPLLGVNEYQALQVVFVLACASWAFFVFPVVWEVTTVLNIRCFFVKPKVKTT